MALIADRLKELISLFFYYNDTRVFWESNWVEDFKMANYASNETTLEDNLLKVLK